MRIKPIPSPPDKPAAAAERYVFVDALRGIAAAAVVFHHIFMAAHYYVPLGGITPPWLYEFSTFGALGVEIFFVLSGFVIAHSLRNTPLTLSSVSNFMLRRQLRLDPPYWIMLCVGLLRLFFKEKGLTPSPVPQTVAQWNVVPTWDVIAANFLYGHNLLHVTEILQVAWTLCLEIQFYVFFIVVLCLGAMPGRTSSGGGKAAAGAKVSAPTLWLVFGTGVLSLALVHLPLGYAVFTRYWFYFASGVLAYWAFQQTISQKIFLSFMGLFAASIAWSLLPGNADGPTIYMAQKSEPFVLLTGAATAYLLWHMGRTGRLTRAWNAPALQYLGKISYSLYLSHMLVISTILRMGYKLTGENPVAGAGWMVVSAIVSVAVGHLLFVLVEKPSMRFAARFKDQSRVKDTRNEPKVPQEVPIPSGFAPPRPEQA